METKIYQKVNNESFLKLFRSSILDIKNSLFLSKQFAKRDIAAQYRQSFLGILWAFITPLLMAFIWIFLNKTGTVKLTDTGVPYPVFAFSGTLLWSILRESINAPLSITSANKSIMTKINFPKEALILTGIYKLLFNSSIKVLILIIFLLFYGVGFKLSLIFFPLTIVGAIVFGTTLGIFITPIGMLYRDVSKFLTIALNLLMYVTPVVYAVPKAGIMKSVMELNPFTPIILTARSVVVGQPPEYLTYFLILMGLSIPLLFLGLVFYRMSMPIIVERMSA